MGHAACKIKEDKRKLSFHGSVFDPLWLSRSQRNADFPGLYWIWSMDSVHLAHQPTSRLLQVGGHGLLQLSLDLYHC
ncbi:hypothetical protein Y1Q_0002660 [Alligator mississippiensis]|uniref:Uncharacterized protein n=1 Tax=Alligator mississippiensis TaxID=8496 RepID=A0A151NYQ7_ALLMI|nr:hypothetical protein Y1Q_0002660 [Alligator mississippiensis]